MRVQYAKKNDQPLNFKEGGIRPEGLSAAWQTGETRRLCRLASCFFKAIRCVILNTAATWSAPATDIAMGRLGENHGEVKFL